MAQPPQDVVGMARTGSGKTLAYLVPLIQRLNGRHSTTFGTKAVILCPSRELALQIVKVGKDIARGWRSDDEARSEAIRWALIVGGEGMDEQFALMTSNPDVVIATPGRLLHLAVEMNLDLRSVEYVVFDEADRLFEMGFAEQLEELLRRLPPTRQTLLFSATLPKSLVEFARAGLESNPKLIRLDADSKISPELRMGFFSVKPSEKEAALLLLLRHVIGVPTGTPAAAERDDAGASGNRKSKKGQQRAHPADELRPYQTIVFCATKHHVEYLLLLLTSVGYSCSHIYSSLDQAARSSQMSQFRSGRTSVLVVTDLAARGIDLPVLEHVINYDFPPQPRVFVHRVGRTARAGRRGWAWSLCSPAELPYLCDLQLFLARPLVSSHRLQPEEGKPLDMHGTLVLGTFPRTALDQELESVVHMMHISSTTATSFESMQGVVRRAHNMYVRSQPKPSQESYRRAKEMAKDAERGAMVGAQLSWALAGGPLEDAGVHDVLRRPSVYGLGDGQGSGVSLAPDDKLAAARSSLLAKVNSFTPGETVFELGARGQHAPLAQLMAERRRTMDGKQRRARLIEEAKRGNQQDDAAALAAATAGPAPAPEADEETIGAVFDTGKKTGAAVGASSYRDPSFYLSYQQEGANDDQGYSLNSGNFAEQAKGVALDLGGDDVGPGVNSQRPNQHRWDSKKKKFVKGDGTGADNQRMIRTESGLKMPASFRSGRYDQWRKEQHVDMPRVGEQEKNLPASVRRVASSLGDRGRNFRHKQNKAPKPLDPKQKDYAKKLKARKRKAEGGAGAPARNELKSAQQIQRERQVKEQRKAKNARPSKRQRR